MEILFEKQYLSDLYYHGRAKDKHHRFQPQIIRKYIRVVDILRNAEKVSELLQFNSLNYKILTGDKKGVESVRVNDQYRVEFTSSLVENESKVTICNILELSNHYKD